MTREDRMGYKEDEERRGLRVEKRTELDYDNLVKRVEDKVVRYIRKRFLEMEQWVDDKMLEEARIGERENKRRDKFNYE